MPKNNNTAGNDRAARALVLGSEPYAGLDRNPAAEIAVGLNGKSIDGVAITGATLPVSYRLLPRRVRSLVAQHRPHIILGLGLLIGSPSVRVETTAINLADFDVADNEGRFVRDEILVADGPPARTARYGAGEIARAIRTRGIPARISHHAGTHLCNAAFYHLLGQVDDKAVAGYLHLPLMPDQVAQLVERTSRESPIAQQAAVDHASMAIQAQIEAVEEAIHCMAAMRLSSRDIAPLVSEADTH